MSKSVLILNTPTSCNNCPCCKHYDHGVFCGVTGGLIIYDMYDFKKKYVFPDCPLSPLPEPKDLTQYTTGSTNLDNIIQYAHDQGYNDCLYELNGGDL